MRISIESKLSELGISRYELAKRIGVTYPTIDNIYKGKSSSIKFDTLESICEELHCTPNDIFIFENSKTKPQLFTQIETTENNDDTK